MIDAVLGGGGVQNIGRAMLFRKPASVAGARENTRISGKELKKLRNDFEAAFGRATVVDTLLPAKVVRYVRRFELSFFPREIAGLKAVCQLGVRLCCWDCLFAHVTVHQAVDVLPAPPVPVLESAGLETELCCHLLCATAGGGHAAQACLAIAGVYAGDEGPRRLRSRRGCARGVLRRL